MYLFFSFSFRYIISCTLVLWPLGDSKHCIYPCYIYLMMLLSHFHLSLHVLFFFSFIHIFLITVCNLLFLFHTKMSWWVLLNCFRNTGCQNLSCHELSSCKVFQEFVLGLDFIVLNKWVWVECFMTSLIFHFFVVVLSRIAKGGDC